MVASVDPPSATYSANGLDYDLDDHEGALYIPITINGVKTSALLDSGCTCSVISPELFDRLSQDHTIKISGPSKLKLADGNFTKSLGRGTFSLTVGSNTAPREQRFVIGVIENDVILGMDFLRENNCSLKFTENLLTMDNSQERCYRIWEPPTDSTAPPQAEDRRKQADELIERLLKIGIIEPRNPPDYETLIVREGHSVTPWGPFYTIRPEEAEKDPLSIHTETSPIRGTDGEDQVENGPNPADCTTDSISSTKLN